MTTLTKRSKTKSYRAIRKIIVSEHVINVIKEWHCVI